MIHRRDRGSAVQRHIEFTIDTYLQVCTQNTRTCRLKIQMKSTWRHNTEAEIGTELRSKRNSVDHMRAQKWSICNNKLESWSPVRNIICESWDLYHPDPFKLKDRLASHLARNPNSVQRLKLASVSDFSEHFWVKWVIKGQEVVIEVRRQCGRWTLKQKFAHLIKVAMLPKVPVTCVTVDTKHVHVEFTIRTIVMTYPSTWR